MQTENDVPVLVLSPRYSHDSRLLRRAASQQGWHVLRLGSRDAPDHLAQRHLVFFGEYDFVQAMANTLSWVLFDVPSDWLAHLPWTYCQRAIAHHTLAEACQLTRSAFVKPATGKAFAAGIYKDGTALAAQTEHLSPLTPVLIAESVHWEIEFRFFVRERAIMTSSSYWRGDQCTRREDGEWQRWPAEEHKAHDFLHTLLADPAVPLPPAIVIDVGKIAGRGWAIIKANPAWAAGLSSCDHLKVLSVLERACVRRRALSGDDARWATQRGSTGNKGMSTA